MPIPSLRTPQVNPGDPVSTPQVKAKSHAIQHSICVNTLSPVHEHNSFNEIVTTGTHPPTHPPSPPSPFGDERLFALKKRHKPRDSISSFSSFQSIFHPPPGFRSSMEKLVSAPRDDAVRAARASVLFLRSVIQTQ
ncbi:hypothetical protein HGRIS_001151 [Hohenbuehelia grisea]|uniref:Uncharacterized protein n=1 Tax=Hohenbuehelia grisea TaxID=104357 RepID=A0ABR3JPS8_9AGAR